MAAGEWCSDVSWWPKLLRKPASGVCARAVPAPASASAAGACGASATEIESGTVSVEHGGELLGVDPVHRALERRLAADQVVAGAVREQPESVNQLDLQFTVNTRYDMTLSIGYAAGYLEGSREDDEFMVSLKIL